MKVGNRDLYLLMITSFTVSLGINAVAPIQPLFMVDVGATEFELGLIFAVSSLLGMASRIPLGILPNRIGRRIMIIIASFTHFASLIFFSFVNDVVWFYPLMVLHTMIWGIFGPSAISLASDTASPERIGTILGLYYTSIGLGQFIGPLICGILTEYMTYQTIFLGLSIFPVVGLIATMRWKSMERGEPMFDSGEVSGAGERIVDSFKRILRSRNMICLCLSRIAFSIPVAIFGTLFSVWAKTELLFTPLLISIIFSARGAANSLIRMPTGSIVDKIGTKKPILLAFSLAFTAFFVFSVTGDFLVILIAVLIYGLGWGMRIVPDTTILTESVESRDRGLALAILMSMFALGRSVGSLVAGVAYTLFPMYIIFQMSAGILFLGFIIIAVAIKTKEPKLDPSIG